MEIIEKDITPSEEEIATYWERGFLVSHKLITDEQIMVIREAVFRMIDGDIDGDVFYYLGP